MLSVGKLCDLFEELRHSSIAPVTLLDAIQLLDHEERSEAALFAVLTCSVRHLFLELGAELDQGAARTHRLQSAVWDEQLYIGAKYKHTLTCSLG